MRPGHTDFRATCDSVCFMEMHFFLNSLCVCVCVELVSHVQLFVTPWTAARQVPLSVGFPRQEY